MNLFCLEKTSWDRLLQWLLSILYGDFYEFFNFWFSSFWWVQGPLFIKRIILCQRTTVWFLIPDAKNWIRNLGFFRLQTTESKEHLIEFTFAQKVTWDNLAVMDSSHFLWEFLQIFQLFNFSFSDGFRDHLSSKESFWVKELLFNS